MMKEALRESAIIAVGFIGVILLLKFMGIPFSWWLLLYVPATMLFADLIIFIILLLHTGDNRK